MTTDTLTALDLPPRSQDLPWPADLRPFDPFDRVIQADPYAHYAWMREHAPVIRAGNPDAPLYIVSRFSDVTQGLRDAAAFSSRPPSAVVPAGFLLSIDPPDHGPLRQTASRAFSPPAVAALEPRIDALVRSRWAAFLDQGEGDAMGAFASPLTISVIATVLGVPVEHSEQMREWTTEMLDWLAVSMRGVPNTSGVTDAGYRKMANYMDGILTAALATSGDNVVANLARLRAEGELTADETAGFVTLMFAAGHETTTLLTGNCLDFLCDQPQWLPYLREEGGAAAFLNEMLRYRPPVHRLTRYVHQDTEIGSYRVPAGASVRFLIGSAGRDDRVFPGADRFDPERSNTANAAFGYGMHMCMGSWLARLEVRLILEQIAATVDHIERAAEFPTEPLTGGPFATVGFLKLGVRIHRRKGRA